MLKMSPTIFDYGMVLLFESSVLAAWIVVKFHSEKRLSRLTGKSRFVNKTLEEFSVRKAA